MFPWRAAIQVEKGSGKPVYLQVANAIIREINEGHLLPGQKIPGERVLGSLLTLNRKTITAAITELQSQGWIESFEHKGTFISKKFPKVEYKPLRYQKPLHKKARATAGVNDLPRLASLHLDTSGKILIDDGVPDVRLAPIKLLFAHQRSILSKKAFASLLKYNHVEGDRDLQVTLASYLQQTRGITSEANNIFITRGSQMGIHLVIAALLKPGETCVTSFPGYPIVDDMINHLGGRVEHIPVDDEGIDTGELERLCRRKKIKLIYTTPHHHYPTTVTLTPSRRIQLLQLAIKYNFYILEDDYAYDFQYDNSPVLPLASLNTSGHVIYIGSFSKCLSPSVRIGYFVAPRNVMESANKLRRIMDRQGDPLLERAMSEFIKCGDLQRHLKKSVNVYQQRRDRFCELVEEHLSGYVNFIKPEGGMSVWMVFKRANVAKTLLEKLSAKGYLLDVDPDFLKKFKAVRIGFASLNENEMARFVATLKGIFSTGHKVTLQ
ncbi:PLP-dependent aminotransferase family protein [Chryseolinea lacunae]|uniref:PLP-dependent aminotransferase family protein n=1 Tax=Chryseolinea lacunae TaxID=2801331 RepID=A0ABS1KYY3_9BACT|nr:PLP-dependent aminotransferase family protein [Chryseolinea lacunae]MBL0744671.1 PLP-dependent aminotransferase family protein [Chryseolinea lacunae]